MQAPLGSVTHIITGAWSAMLRKRASLSRSAASAALRSVMSTETASIESNAPSSAPDRGHAVAHPDDGPVRSDVALLDLEGGPSVHRGRE